MAKMTNADIEKRQLEIMAAISDMDEQTNVGLREASEAIDKAIEEQLKRECGDDEAKKKAEEEAAKRAAEEEAKKKAEEEEAAKREAEAKAKEEREARELEEQEQRFREQQAMRLRAPHRRREIDIESLNYYPYKTFYHGKNA